MTSTVVPTVSLFDSDPDGTPLANPDQVEYGGTRRLGGPRTQNPGGIAKAFVV